MNELPSGWYESKLVNLCHSISRGKSPIYTDFSSLPVINQRSLRWTGIETKYLKYVDEDQIPAWTADRYIQEGDILVNSTGTGTIGRAYLVQLEDTIQRKVVDSHITIIRPIKEIINPAFLLAFFKSSSTQNLIKDLATGTTNQIELKKSVIENMLIAIAPLQEQNRIIHKMNLLFRSIDSSIESVSQALVHIENLRKSILHFAKSGELTVDFRHGKLPNWQKEKAIKVCEKVQKGGTPKVGFSESGIPFLKIYNIVNQKIDFIRKQQFVDENINETVLGKSQTFPGDVLMNIVGPPLGKVAIVPDTFSSWNINQALVLFRPNMKILSGWIYILLCSGENVASIMHETSGSAGQINISLSQCRDFIFSVPPIDEQKEIIKRTEKLMTFADRIEKHCQDCRAQLEGLFSIILERIFAAKLVAQHSGDQSALSNFLKVQKDIEEVKKLTLITVSKGTLKKSRVVKKNSSKTLQDLINILESLGGEASANTLLSATLLDDNIDLFFDFLREGMNIKSLEIPVGYDGNIKLLQDENNPARN